MHPTMKIKKLWFFKELDVLERYAKRRMASTKMSKHTINSIEVFMTAPRVVHLRNILPT
jgi:hypothetical protein